MRTLLPALRWALSRAFRYAPAELTLNVAANLVQGLVTGLTLHVTRLLVDAATGRAEPAHFLRLLLWLGSLLLLGRIFSAIDALTVLNATEKASLGLREEVLRKTAQLELIQFDNPAVHDQISRATSGPGASLISNMARTAPHLLRYITEIIAAVAVVATASPWVAAFSFAVAVPVAWAGARQGKRTFNLWLNQTQDSRLSLYLGALLSDRPSATELRAYGLLPGLMRLWRQVFDRMQNQTWAMWLTNTREGWGASMAATLLYAGTLAAFAQLAGRESISAGMIVAAAGAIRLLRDCTTGLAQSATQVWEQLLPLSEVQKLLLLPGRDSGHRTIPDLPPGPIRFEGVSFTYPGQTAPAVTGVDLTIAPGERIALVGANGAGKTTLVKLLLGLYTPTQGRITVGGADLSQVQPEALTTYYSCIFQDFAKFAMTVAENVALGRPDATRAEVEAACAAAGATGLIRDLPKGYDTMLGRAFDDGVELSGGQWQRVALARAFLRDAACLVLDEPTAALDARAELDVFRKFVDLAAGRTAVLISHRLGVTRLADRIIVMEDGRILETGTHAELMAAGGRYAELFTTQAQWYQANGEVTAHAALS